MDWMSGQQAGRPGWTREGGDLYETLHRLDRPVVLDSWSPTFLRRHASGPNLELLRRVCEETERRSSPVAESPRWRTSVAFGGHGRIGVEGAIIGTALYVGRFTIEEALGGRAAE